MLGKLYFKEYPNGHKLWVVEHIIKEEFQDGRVILRHYQLYPLHPKQAIEFHDFLDDKKGYVWDVEFGEVNYTYEYMIEPIIHKSAMLYHTISEFIAKEFTIHEKRISDIKYIPFISDKEIEEAAKKYVKCDSDLYAYKLLTFIKGAKWYRKELKKIF